MKKEVIMISLDYWHSIWSDKIHSDEFAQKRIESATKATLTPKQIDIENGLGSFIGSSKDEYKTSLQSCTCIDFGRNKRPCKHIYRLAMECGLLQNNFSSYKEGKALSWQEIADKIELLPNNTQLEFLELIRGIKNNERREFKRKKKQELEDLFKTHIIFNDESKNTPKFYFVIIPEDSTAEIYKVFQYSNRKFFPPSEGIFDENLEETRIYKPLENDDRTSRLLKKGFAIQTNNGIYIKDHVPF